MIYSIIETARLILQTWKPDDLPLFTEMNKNARVMRYFPAIVTDEQTESFYNRIQSEFEHPNFSPDSTLRTHLLYQIDL
ncbi:MAG: GNAT family N-acetyltransferase [Muribaculaceae bacterium]|nr:GNAT family N-acetyltransferase [Muribaculaceae bacterium]